MCILMISNNMLHFFKNSFSINFLVRSIKLTIIVFSLAIMSCNDPNIVKQSFFSETQLEAQIVDTSFNNQFTAQILEKSHEFLCPGVAVIVMKNNQVIYEHNFGIKHLGSVDSINSNSVFRLGSVSKGFAGLLAAVLIDKNKFSLHDPVSKYVPELTLKARSDDDTLRIQHILSHSTGLTEHAFSNLVDENHSMSTIIANLNRISPRDSTGKSYAYQNATFGLIERVITGATGLTYQEALDYYIFSPLEMCSSSCTYQDLLLTQNICNGHKSAGGKNGFRQIDFSPHYYNVASAGGVNASLNDMKKWLSAVMGYRPDVLNAHTRSLAFSPYISTINDDKYFNRWPSTFDSNYGLGWRLIRTDNNNLVYHGGLVNGFRAEIAFDAEKDLGIVMLFNSTCKYSNNAVQLFYDLWNKSHEKCDSSFL